MRRVKLGDVEFDVVDSENPKDSATVTGKPVESGQDVSDHVKQNPSTINLSGQMTVDAAKKLSTLKKYQREGKLLKYVGRNAYDNMVIVEIDREHGTRNRRGYQFSMQLKHVRIAVAKGVEIKVSNPVTKKPSNKTNTKVKPNTGNGMQQTNTKSVTSGPMSKADPPYRQVSLQEYVSKQKKQTPTEKIKGIADAFGVPPRPKPGYIHSDTISGMPGGNWVRVE